MSKVKTLRTDAPLKLAIERDQLVMRIGIRTLAFSAAHCPLFYDDEHRPDAPYVQIADDRQLASDIVRELCREKEDGSSPISDVLDAAIMAAFEDGSLGFAEEGK